MEYQNFLVGEYSAFYNGYNVYFKEYMIPVENEELINEIKGSDIKYYELPDGSIHFNKITYENVIIEAVE